MLLGIKCQFFTLRGLFMWSLLNTSSSDLRWVIVSQMLQQIEKAVLSQFCLCSVLNSSCCFVKCIIVAFDEVRTFIGSILWFIVMYYCVVKAEETKIFTYLKELDLLLYQVHLENPFPNASKRSWMTYHYSNIVSLNTKQGKCNR